MLGPGEGDAEIRAIRDRQEPAVLRTVHVVGGDKAAWTDLDVPLEPFAGQVISLELRAAQSARGGRVLFGDPVLVGPAEQPPAAPPARAVVIVALNGVERSDLPPWSGRADPRLPTLSELAASATTFDHHRAPSTLVSGVMASVLTGLPPQGHTVDDAAARLPERMTTIGAIARDSSVRSAMLTGVPTTFRAFGFASGWGRFVEHPPASGDPATTPIDAAAAWITETAREGAGARLLVVVHARGGHPPWEVPPKELSALKPADYTGPIEPRRAGQALARIRSSWRRAKILTSNDRDRIRDLSAIALSGQDRALGGVISALKTAGLWDETLLVVTGDVASGRSDDALYGDALDLAEPTLTLPLYVRFPGDLYAGLRVAAPTEIVDIPRTALAALRLAFAQGRKVYGSDLAAVASGRDGIERDPQVAVLGERYSTRWGALVLFGRFGTPPFLCDLALDPTCAFNRRDVMAHATMALFRRTVAFDAATRAPASYREPATIDPDTAAQLSVWGAR
jgi:arylsulfatase A-like enzyme